MNFRPLVNPGDSILEFKQILTDYVDLVSASVVIDGFDVYWQIEGGTTGVMGRCEVQIKTVLGDRVVAAGIVDVKDS